MSLLSFDQSGSGEAAVGPLSLAAVQQLCCDCGFVKSGVEASKPLAQRADTAAFFKVLGVNSLSAFRTLFYAERVPAPRPGQAPPAPAPKKKAVVAAAPAEAASTAGATKAYPVPDVAKYGELAASFETLKWRIIPRPGGATMKPEDYYAIYAAKQQAESGDNAAEKPMWAETGGLDFDGRERWEAWTKLAGTSKADAQRAFCEAYARAMSREADNFRRF